MPHGSLDASDDPAQIAAWFTGETYGVAVTGILAIDGDDLDATFTCFGDDLMTGVQIQGNPDRMSFLFAQPDDPYGDGKHPGGEVKGSGYVVLPPSVHDGGDECVTCQMGTHTYQWVSEWDTLPPIPASHPGGVAGRPRPQAARLRRAVRRGPAPVAHRTATRAGLSYDRWTRPPLRSPPMGCPSTRS